MKQNAIASLAALALLSAGSLAYAAEVTGGNVAVVVQRASVPSASGYQLLCVPVKGLDITGSATSSNVLTLDQVLPPAAYGNQPTNETSIATTDQCRVTAYLQEGDPVTAKIVASYDEDSATWSYAWKNLEASTSLGGTELKCGTVLWFYNPKDQKSSGGSLTSALSQGATASLAAEDTKSQVTFCGQQNKAQTAITCGGDSQLQKIGNETSEEIFLSDLFTDDNCAVGTQIFRIADKGDVNYTIYVKRPSGWVVRGKTGGSTSVSLDEVTLAPGEAIYYFAM